jgi:hypothetical protein
MMEASRESAEAMNSEADAYTSLLPPCDPPLHADADALLDLALLCSQADGGLQRHARAPQCSAQCCSRC